MANKKVLNNFFEYKLREDTKENKIKSKKEKKQNNIFNRMKSSFIGFLQGLNVIASREGFFIIYLTTVLGIAIGALIGPLVGMQLFTVCSVFTLGGVLYEGYLHFLKKSEKQNIYQKLNTKFKLAAQANVQRLLKTKSIRYRRYNDLRSEILFDLSKKERYNYDIFFNGEEIDLDNVISGIAGFSYYKVKELSYTFGPFEYDPMRLESEHQKYLDEQEKQKTEKEKFVPRQKLRDALVFLQIPTVQANKSYIRARNARNEVSSFAKQEDQHRLFIEDALDNLDSYNKDKKTGKVLDALSGDENQFFKTLVKIEEEEKTVVADRVKYESRVQKLFEQRRNLILEKATSESLQYRKDSGVQEEMRLLYRRVYDDKQKDD